jgi:hypothetical protein
MNARHDIDSRGCERLTDSRDPATTPSRLVALALVVACVAASGASCPQVLRGYQVGVMPLPRTLPVQATLDQVIAAVHDNSQRVRSYAASQAVLAVPGVPRLTARVASEPPRRFRLQARTAVTGDELDLGSNDDLFWLWIRRHQPPVMLFCRHDQYESSSARRLLPIRADWFPELLGLVQFRPEDRHEGPFPLPDGRIEIRSRIAAGGSAGAAPGADPVAGAAAPVGSDELVKSTILDGTTGLVIEQHLFTAAGVRLASVRTTRHRVDATSGAALPHLVEVSWPASEVEFTLEITSITTNMPSGDPGQLWQMPAYPGYAPVDLADPSITITPPAAAGAATTAGP